MKFILTIIIFFGNIYHLLAIEFACNFEEVYKDGFTQQGLVLLKKDSLRYEYLDKNLFTIIYKNGETTISKNNNRKQINSYDVENNLINHLVKITKDHPFFEKNYIINDYKIIVEKSSNIDFIKRLAIVSDDLNLSIYFQNCKSGEILDLYFQHSPYFRYNF